METTISYLVDESNRRQAVQITYAEWKQLKQRLLDAEMQFWEIQRLDKEIRKFDLELAIQEIRHIEAGQLPTKTIAEIFDYPPSVVGLSILVTSCFYKKAKPLLAKYPALKQELLALPQHRLGGPATVISDDYLSFGSVLLCSKKKSQPAMRVEVHFICKYQLGAPSTAPLYLAAIYDKSERKLIEPPFAPLI